MNTTEEILSILLTSIKSKGITEKDCLIANEINTSFLTDWKKGRLKTPSYDKVIKLAQYLEISLDFLFLNSKVNTEPPLNLTNTAENDWLNIYRETPAENQPHLLAMAQAFAQSLPKSKHPRKSSTSPNTDENAAAIDDSHIA